MIDSFSYAGIGSRETPEQICDHMIHLAWGLGLNEHKLRTGGADGADTAFIRGSRLGTMRAEIYLPWPGYNGWTAGVTRKQPRREAYKIAAEYHPAWDHLSQGAKKLHARNIHIILGLKLDSPADFVVCWTPDGSLGDKTNAKTGGTGQALRMAYALDIEVVNMQIPSHLERVRAMIGI